jgi:hypothetical protein
VSEEDEIFIQNRVEVNSPSEKPQHEDYHSRFSGDFKPRETVYVPSYILHFKKNGDLSAMLGVFGKNSEPFRYIESMEARSDFLFVCHRFAEQLILTKFENDEWKGEINESNLIVLSSEETADYKVSLEKIIPHPSGEYAFVALIYTGKKDDRFKFKRIYKYNYNSPTPETLIKETQDPSESLFGFGPGEDFYIWETEDSEKSIKLKVHDREGNHYNNLRLKFPLPRVQWRETYIGPRNQIFSTRVRGDALEVYEWK